MIFANDHDGELMRGIEASAPADRRFSGWQKAAEGCRSPKPGGVRQAALSNLRG